MKKIVTILSLVVIVPALFIAFKPGEKALPETPQYIVIGWNDLGMHCANKDFSSMCVLPPYNNQTAHVILRGSQSQLPQVMGLGSGFYVTYEIPGNTYSVGKTNFWTYAYQLFGVNLPNNIGLTGVGLTGTMWDSSNYFHVSGIPVTPYQDADLTHESPFQLTLLKAYDAGNNVVAQTQDVIPVSNEINCVSSGCHTSEQQILTNHEENLPAPPVLCASCHADPVLGTTGNPEAGYFSMRMHQQHGSITNDCYKCHPGPNTQCFRDIMFTHGLTCQTCHGSVSNVGNTIAAGRTPWLQEPSCGAVTCHGPNFAEEPNTLYRNSQGHGNLFCSTCHGSPHAILPTIQPNDNLQNITLQGYSGTLSKCEVCHGYIPAGPGPHGFNPLGIKPVSDLIPDRDEILPNYPNPFNFMTNIPYHVKKAGFVTLEVYNMEGLKVKTLMQDNLTAGEYKAELYSSGIPSGTYICKLQNGTSVDTRKIVLSK